MGLTPSNPGHSKSIKQSSCPMRPITLDSLLREVFKNPKSFTQNFQLSEVKIRDNFLPFSVV